MTLAELLPQQSFALMVVFARVSGLVMLMPGFDQVYVPARVRLSAALLITLVLLPLVNVPPVSSNGLETFIVVAQELLVGLFLGMLAKFMLLALDIAGTIIGIQAGISNATLLNPGLAQQGALVGALMTMVGMAALFAADMHHLTFYALASSYEVFPLGQWMNLADGAAHTGQIFGKSFSLAVQMAAPMIILGLLFNVGVGLLSRLMPQVQIFFITVSGQILMGLFVTALAATAIIALFLQEYQDTFVGVL